jgi:hypothetical protein
MARMTPAEATAVNNVISYIVAKEPTPPAELVRSLYILASRAHNRLQGGWHEDAVKRQWPYAFADGVPVAAASPTDPPTPSGPVNQA